MTNSTNKQDRIGIFGGTFNPVHVGHLNSILTVKQKLGLQKIFVVPSRQNPLRPPIEGASPEDRLAMVELAFADYPEDIEIDDTEIKQEGPSYSIHTVRRYVEEYGSDNVYLIIGVDNLEHFPGWKEYKEILSIANLAVTSRPGSMLPYAIEDLPAALQEMVSVFDRGCIQLKTGRFIDFVVLKDMDVSSTDARKKLRLKHNVSAILDFRVESYIKSHNLYESLGAKIGDFEQFTKYCGQALFDKKGIAVKGFDLRNLSAPTEFAIIASGTSSRHTSALAENLMKDVKDEFGVYPQGIEGLKEGRWVLLDYGSLIVHIFYDFVRQEYRLEDLWRGGKDMQLVDKNPVETSQN